MSSRARSRAARVCVLLIPLALSASVPRPAAAAATLDGRPPVVIGHRGASAYRPEHTLAAYRLAIDQGADFIEPDLVSTKDGVLVARHEHTLALADPATGRVTSATTNVAELPAFASRRTTKVINGASVTGWFVEDFTLEELKLVRAREPMRALRPGSARHNDRFGIPTLQQILNLAKRESLIHGRTIGVYAEAKDPAYFDRIGLSLEEPLLATLEANGYRGPEAPVVVASFDHASLVELNARTGVRLAQVAYSPTPLSPQVLAYVREYAEIIAPNKEQIIPRDAEGKLAGPTSLVGDAHAAGLLVHPWTFRGENAFLPSNYQGDSVGEMRAYLATGIDGLFTDNPNRAVDARASFGASGRAAALPEPSTLAMLAASGLALLKRRRTSRR